MSNDSKNLTPVVAKKNHITNLMNNQSRNNTCERDLIKDYILCSLKKNIKCESKSLVDEKDKVKILYKMKGA